MVITEPIRAAIQAAIKKSGSSHSFSRSIGVSHTTVSFWLNGRTRKINSTVWMNLLPQIREFLGPDESMSYPCAPVAAGNTPGLLHEAPAAWYGAGSMTSVPLLHLEDLADFDPQIDPMEEIIREKSLGAVTFTSPVLPGYFAVEIGKELNGFFPAGTRLLLRWQEFPGDGDTVLVKLRGKKEFVFASFQRKDTEIVLTPLVKGGRKHKIPKAEFHNVCSWIVPIREAVCQF